MNFFKLSLSIVAVSFLTIGCGGGGGGSSTSNSISFPSDATSAEPTLENGKKVEDAVASNQSSGLPTLNSVNNSTSLNSALLTKDISDNLSQSIKGLKFNNYSLNQTINEREDCSHGGNISYSGSGDEHGGSVTLNINRCNNGEELLNGSVYISVSNYDTQADDFKDISMKFTSDYTVKNLSDNKTITISKGSYLTENIIEFNNYDEASKYKLRMSIKASDGTNRYGLKDAIYYFHEEDYKTSVYQTDGRVYIDNLASYVDYDKSYNMSKTPFVYQYEREIPVSGEARYIMKNNSKVKIVAENNDVITYIDSDGDGSYELSELN